MSRPDSITNDVKLMYDALQGTIEAQAVVIVRQQQVIELLRSALRKKYEARVAAVTTVRLTEADVAEIRSHIQSLPTGIVQRGEHPEHRRVV